MVFHILMFCCNHLLFCDRLAMWRSSRPQYSSSSQKSCRSFSLVKETNNCHVSLILIYIHYQFPCNALHQLSFTRLSQLQYSIAHCYHHHQHPHYHHRQHHHHHHYYHHHYNYHATWTQTPAARWSLLVR